MIGVVANAGRIAGTQLARQAGREIGEEALRRLLARESLEDLLSRDARQSLASSAELRDQIKLLGKRGVQLMMRELGNQVLEDNKKKQEHWNDRMNNFARNLNDHYKQHRTLYAEERNVQNKEKVEDRWGLRNAYWSPSGLYKTGKTLYISGTGGKDGSLTQDIMDDLLLLPTRNAHNTEKYKDVMKELEKSPEISRLVSHSLGSAVVNKINEEKPNKFATTTYATPTIKGKRKGKQDPRRLDYRNKNDIVSALDGYAVTQDINEFNPLVAHTFKTFEGNGLYNINAGTRISNGINPNQ